MERHAAVRRRASLDVLPASPRSQKGSLRQHPSHVKAPKQLSRRTSLPFASEMHTEQILLDCPGFPQTGFTAAAPRLVATSQNADETVSLQPCTTQLTIDAPSDRPMQPRARKVTCEALQRRRQSLDSGAPVGVFDRESTTTTSGRASRSAHTRTIALPHVASARTARRLRSFDDRYGGTATHERDCDTTIVTVDSTFGPHRRRHTRRGSADHVTSAGIHRTAFVGVCGAETSAQSTPGGRRLANRRAHRRSSLESNTSACPSSRKDEYQSAITLANVSELSFTTKLRQCDERPLSPKVRYGQVPPDFCYEFDDDHPDAKKRLVKDSDFPSQWNVDPFVTPMQQDKPKIASRRASKPHHVNAAAVATTLDTRTLGLARDTFEGFENSARTNMTGTRPSDWSRAESGSSPGHRTPGSGRAAMLSGDRRESARNSADSRLNRFRRSNSMQPGTRLERNAIRSQSRGRSTSLADGQAPTSVLTSQPSTDHWTSAVDPRSSRNRSHSLQPPVTSRHRADSLRVTLKSPKAADRTAEESPRGVTRPRHQDRSLESTPKRFVGHAELNSVTSLPSSSPSKASKCFSKSKRSLSFNAALAPPSTPTTVASSVVSNGCVAPRTNRTPTDTVTRLSAESSSPSLAAWHQKQRRRASGSHVLGDCKSVQSSISVLQQHQTIQSQRQRKIQTNATTGSANSSSVQWTHPVLPTHGSSESALKW